VKENVKWRQKRGGGAGAISDGKKRKGLVVAIGADETTAATGRV
jgi:hypothetical protein